MGHADIVGFRYMMQFRLPLATYMDEFTVRAAMAVVPSSRGGRYRLAMNRNYTRGELSGNAQRKRCNSYLQINFLKNSLHHVADGRAIVDVHLWAADHLLDRRGEVIDAKLSGLGPAMAIKNRIQADIRLCCGQIRERMNTALHDRGVPCRSPATR